MVFLGLSIQAWITLAVILFIILSQFLSKIPTDAVYLFSMLVLVLTGVLGDTAVFAGLVTPASLTVLFFYVITGCLRNTGALSWLTKKLFGKHRNNTVSLLRMMLPSFFLSAFISNPTAGEIMYQPIAEWSRKNKLAASKFLLPVAYIIGLSGSCTVIGYPINLIVFSFCESATGVHYNIFAPLLGGLACTLVGIAYIILMQRRLPQCPDPQAAAFNTEEYIVEMLVPSDNNAVFQTIQDLKLNKLEYGQLVSIVRFDHYVISPVKPDEPIFGGDRLVFSGHIEPLLELRNSMGFANSTKHLFNIRDNEGVKKNIQFFSIPPKSSLVGKRMVDIPFEEENVVTLVALMRASERAQSLPRETELQAGDLLLFEGEKIRLAEHNNMLVPHQAPPIIQPTWRTWVSLAVMALAIFLPALGVVSLLPAVFCATMVLCGIKCCSRAQAWSSINWTIMTMMTGAFCISAAMKESGLADALSNTIMQFCGTDPMQATIVLTGTAIVMTQFIFDASVVAVLIPIAIQLSATLGVSPLPLAMAVMLGTSCNLTTHISTAHMIPMFSLGGFKVSDITKFGLPLCLIMFVTIILVVKLFYPF